MILNYYFRKNIGCLVTLFILCASLQAQNGTRRSCNFDINSLSFGGTSIEQARCLLRRVKSKGELEQQVLPNLLEKIIDQPVQVIKESLREYLRTKVIEESEIGGSLDKPISKGRSNDPSAPLARYFVIHDTSMPNLCEANTFPDNINDADWIWNGIKWNDPRKRLYTDSEAAHLYIMRDGKSVAPQGRTFETPWRATKLEKTSVKTRGMFLHIENVQPRHCHPDSIKSGTCVKIVKNTKTGKDEKQCNDNIAPEIGFPEPQLERLALAYIAASVRRGKWLIPAFHAAIDKGISGGHDDPQNFELQKWADKICLILKELKAECPG